MPQIVKDVRKGCQLDKLASFTSQKSSNIIEPNRKGNCTVQNGYSTQDSVVEIVKRREFCSTSFEKTISLELK